MSPGKAKGKPGKLKRIAVEIHQFRKCSDVLAAAKKAHRDFQVLSQIDMPVSFPQRLLMDLRVVSLGSVTSRVGF